MKKMTDLLQSIKRLLSKKESSESEPGSVRPASSAVDTRYDVEDGFRAASNMDSDFSSSILEDAASSGATSSGRGVSELIHMDGESLVILPEWVSLQSSRPGKKQLSRIAGKERGFIHLSSRDGKMPMAAFAEQKSGAILLSASLARAGHDCVVILPLGDGRIWATAVHNGTVVSGFEVCGSSDDVFSEVHTFLTTIMPLNIKIHKDLYPAHQLGGHGDPIDSVSNLLSKESMAAFERAKNPINAKSITVVALFLAAIGSSVVVYNMFFVKSVAVPAIKSAEEIEAERMQGWRDGLARALASKELFSSWPWDVADNAVQLRGATGLYGWTYLGSECSPAQCASSWKGAKIRNIERFTAQVNPPDTFSLSHDGQNMIVRSGFERIKNYLAVSKDTLERLPITNEVKDRWMDQAAWVSLIDPGFMYQWDNPISFSPIGVNIKKDKPKGAVPNILTSKVILIGKNMASFTAVKDITEDSYLFANKLTIKINNLGLVSEWKLELENVTRL